MSTKDNSQISVLYSPEKGIPPRTGIMAVSYSQPDQSGNLERQMLWLTPNVPLQLPVDTIKILKAYYPQLWNQSVLSEMGLELPDPSKLSRVNEDFALEIIDQCDSLKQLKEYAKFAYSEILKEAIADRISVLTKELSEIQFPETEAQTIEISKLSPTEAKKLINKENNIETLIKWQSQTLTETVRKTLENKIDELR